MCLLYRMLTPTCGRFAASMSVLALCTYPAAVTLQVGYSESVAMLLILVALWCLREQRYVALLVTGLVLAFTRPIVLPLALVVGAHWVARWRRRRDEPFPRGEAIGVAVVGGVIAASFIFWPIVVVWPPVVRMPSSLPRTPGAIPARAGAPRLAVVACGARRRSRCRVRALDSAVVVVFGLLMHGQPHDCGVANSAPGRGPTLCTCSDRPGRLLASSVRDARDRAVVAVPGGGEGDRRYSTTTRHRVARGRPGSCSASTSGSLVLRGHSALDRVPVMKF